MNGDKIERDVDNRRFIDREVVIVVGSITEGGTVIKRKLLVGTIRGSNDDGIWFGATSGIYRGRSGGLGRGSSNREDPGLVLEKCIQIPMYSEKGDPKRSNISE